MDAWTRVLKMWDRNWKGQAFDGRCLKDELAAHTAEQAADARTVEGYTVWGIALHVHRYKEILLANLEGRTPVLEAEEDFPAVPSQGLTQARWAEVQQTMAATHDALVARAQVLDEAFLDSIYPPWNITWGETLIWAGGHDGYHAAQIRNMKR